MNSATQKFRSSFLKTSTSFLSLIAMVVAMVVVIPNISQADENAYLTNGPLTDRYGSSYWGTSAVREWLNNKTISEYTNAGASAVGYNSDGFLKDFTADELNAIAVTEHKSFVAGDWNISEGGTKQTYYADGLASTSMIDIFISNIKDDWKNYYYRTFNDEMFILNGIELYEYVYKRGLSLKKTRLTNNTAVTYVTGNLQRSNTWSDTNWVINTDGNIAYSTMALSSYGIVPAMFLKPTYQVSANKIASQLNIGDTVTFGRYNNIPITWSVINITPNGYPLIWSDHSIAEKSWSGKIPVGQVHRDSINTNFENFDVSIKDDMKFYNGTSDITEPYLSVQNPEAVTTKTNDPFDLVIKATDSSGGSGINYIILPDGSKVYSDTVNYTVTKNGTYPFTAVDNSGNHYGFTVPIAVINPPAEVQVIPSTTEWTNKNVTVNVTTTEAGTTWDSPGLHTSGSFSFPTLTTYANKRISVSGDVRLTGYNESLPWSGVKPRFLFTYKTLSKVGNNWRVSNSYPAINGPTALEMTSIPMDEDGGYGWYHLEGILTVSGSYFPPIQVSIGNTAPTSYSGAASFQFKDVHAELLDKADFSIDHIILPNGETINDSSYTDTLTSSGTYDYSVVDNVGQVTTQSVEVKIDKTKPTMIITGNPTDWVNHAAELTVTGIDADSGVKQIQTPDGGWIEGSVVNYSATENGSYIFIVEDNAGNQFSKTVVVDKLDNITPTGVTASPGNGQATVSWNKPTNQGSPATKYVVTSNPEGKTCETYDVNDTSCVITGLTNGQEYTFTVVASNETGSGAPSVASNTIVPRTVPSEPTNVTAVSSNSQSFVSWTASTDNGGAIITSYTVTSIPGSKTCQTTGNPPATSCIVSGLTNGTSYVFTVKAGNSAGYSSESSPSNSVIPMTFPNAPSNIQVTPSNEKITVTWALDNDGGSPVDTYTAILNPGNIQKVVTEKSAIFENLSNGSEYSITIHAHNIVGDGPESSVISGIVPFTTPNSPINVTAVPGDQQAEISWIRPENNQGREITRYTVTSTLGNNVCSTSSADDTSCVITGLTNGEAYTFTVTATNEAGDSIASLPSDPVTPFGVPEQIEKPTTTLGYKNILLNWETPDNNGSPITMYKISFKPSNVPGAIYVQVNDPTETSKLFEDLERFDENGNLITYAFSVRAVNEAGTSQVSLTTNGVSPLDVSLPVTNVTVTKGSSQATISWNAPSNNGGSSIIEYTVTGQPGNISKTVSGNETNTVVTGLTNGTEYSFTVVATNAFGDSNPSESSNNVTPLSVPSQPKNLSIIEGNQQVSLSWSAPDDNGGAIIDQYLIEDNSKGISETVDGDEVSKVITDLINGEEYTFTIKAHNSEGYGNSSTFSKAVPKTTPGTVRNISVIPGDSFVEVSWDSPSDNGGSSVTGYHIVSIPEAFETTTANTLIYATGLTNGTQYTFMITAINDAGEGESLESNEVTPVTIPSSPSNVSVNRVGDTAIISWEKPDDNGGEEITGYTVTSDPDGLTCSTDDPDETSCEITGLNPITTYSFFVVALNNSGSSDPGVISGATPSTDENGQVNATVDSSISLTLDSDDNTVNLTGIPGLEDVISPDNTISYIVATNNLSGYSVNVKSDTEVLNGNIGNNFDKILFNFLTIKQDDGIGSGSNYFALGTQDQKLYSQSSKSSSSEGDRMTSFFKLDEMPWVNADDYTGTVTYTATVN